MAAIAWIKRIVEIIGNLGNLGGQVYSKIVDESITLGMVRDRGGDRRSLAGLSRVVRSLNQTNQ